ncbi:MAG: helix-turn-helix domain-containing protein, partial [Acidimicrobiales bacterium]
MSRRERSSRRRREVRRHRVTAIAGPEVAAFELAVAHEVFGLQRPELGLPWYEFRVAAVEPEPIAVTDSDWTISTPWGLEILDETDTVVIPAWKQRDVPTRPELLDALRAIHARGGRIVSVCSGAFLMAETGLLDGRSATTHWMYAAELAKKYPAIEVDPDVLYVDGGDGLYTSAGTAAGIDLCLHIVRLDHGADVANAVARRMVVPPQRDGGQAQFVAAPVPDEPDDDAIARTLDWALEHLDQPLSVEVMARRTLLSPRTFARRFRHVTGTTPLQWLLRQRILHAQRLLEGTELPIELVASQCGFGTATALRVHFRRATGTTPTAYRRAFTSRSLSTDGRQ